MNLRQTFIAVLIRQVRALALIAAFAVGGTSAASSGGIGRMAETEHETSANSTSSLTALGCCTAQATPRRIIVQSPPTHSPVPRPATLVNHPRGLTSSCPRDTLAHNGIGVPKLE